MVYISHFIRDVIQVQYSKTETGAAMNLIISAKFFVLKQISIFFLLEEKCT